MPKKKKAQLNGFSLYMQEIRPQLEREGRVFPNGMRDVVEVAHPRWQRLPVEERNRYDKIAKEERQRQSASLIGKLTSDGRLISDVKKQESDERNMHENMKKSICNWIHTYLTDIQAVMKEKFYFINFNITCEVLGERIEEVSFIPNEVGIVEYSIAKGISRVYHKFIDPGCLPMGYAFAAKQHSDDTHKIPSIGFDKADDNYVGIWIQIMNFINQDEHKRIYPPMFVIHDQMKQTKGCIDWLYERSAEQRKNMLRVFDINYLLLELRARIGHPLASISEARNLLSKNLFDYITEICCDWHQEQDCVECAVGAAKRSAYLMSDSLCHLYEVDLTKNHLPEQSDVSYSITIKRDETPSYESQYSEAAAHRSLSQASGYSQNYYSQDFSQNTNFSQPTIDSVDESLSQVTLEDCGSYTDDLSQATTTVDNNNEDYGWTSVGRGITRKRGACNSQDRVRQPGQFSSNKNGFGRGLMKRQ